MATIIESTTIDQYKSCICQGKNWICCERSDLVLQYGLCEIESFCRLPNQINRLNIEIHPLRLLKSSAILESYFCKYD